MAQKSLHRLTSGMAAVTEQRRFLLSSQHQPGFPHTSWCSSRAASLQDSASAFLAISGSFFSSQCCSSIFLPEQQQQNQILPQTDSAQPWLPLPITVGPAWSCSSAVPVLGTSSPSVLCFPLRARLGRGARSPPACRPPHLQPPGMPGTASRDHRELPLSLPGVCKG